MKKDLDWNQAIRGNEDWKAACDSEIFTNYVGIVLAKEQREKALKKAAQEQAEETKDFMKGVPNPLRANEDYGKYNNEDGENPFGPDNNIDVSFGTNRDAISDSFLAGSASGADNFSKGELNMPGDGDDSGAYNTSAIGGGDTSADDYDNDYTEGDGITADASDINAMIEADAMRLYDENIKQAKLNRAEKNLGLDDNMYYQVLRAEKGVK